MRNQKPDRLSLLYALVVRQITAFIELNIFAVLLLDRLNLRFLLILCWRIPGDIKEDFFAFKLNRLLAALKQLTLMIFQLSPN